MSNKPSPENKPFDIPTTSSSGIPVVGGSPPPIPHVAVVSEPEIVEVSGVPDEVIDTGSFRNTTHGVAACKSRNVWDRAEGRKM